VVPERTEFPAAPASQETPECRANRRQFACHPRRQRANRAHLVRPDPRDSLETKDPAVRQATKDPLAKTHSPAALGHWARPALLVNLDPSDPPAMPANQPKARRPLPENPDHPVRPAEMDHPDRTAAQAPTVNQAALDLKARLVRPAPTAIPAPPANPVAKDHPANKESLAFARNIAHWTAACFLPTECGDKRLEKSIDRWQIVTLISVFFNDNTLNTCNLYIL